MHGDTSLGYSSIISNLTLSLIIPNRDSVNNEKKITGIYYATQIHCEMGTSYLCLAMSSMSNAVRVKCGLYPSYIMSALADAPLLIVAACGIDEGLLIYRITLTQAAPLQQEFL